MPDPIALTMGPLKLHWYGLMYLLAFIQFLFLGHIRLKQKHIALMGWKKKDLEDILFYGVFGVIIGGRLGEVFFYYPSYYFSNPSDIVAIWKGGMSFHGGLLGVLVTMYLWSYKHNRDLMDTMDFITPMIPLGYAAGRFGNFINAELPGRIASSSLPWSIIWPNIDELPRHPSPIYQMLVDGILLFIIIWIFSSRIRPRMAVSGMFSILYGCARFFTECFRMPDYNIIFNNVTISAGQMLSIPMILLGFILLKLAYYKSSNKIKIK